MKKLLGTPVKIIQAHNNKKGYLVETEEVSITRAPDGKVVRDEHGQPLVSKTSKMRERKKDNFLYLYQTVHGDMEWGDKKKIVNRHGKKQFKKARRKWRQKQREKENA